MQSYSDEAVSVLLVSHQDDDLELIASIINQIDEPSFMLEHCATFDEARHHINNHTHDVFLINNQLDKRSGIDLIKLADPDKHLEPFILLADAPNKQLEDQAIRLGASDYLVKNMLDSELLSRSLNYSLGRKEVEAQRLQHLIELNQAKDEFISVASHQLRTPATGVKQYIGILLQGIAGEVSEEQRKILIKAYDSNERQLKIVSDLLKIARVDAGKVILDQTKVNMNQLIGDVVREQSEIARERQQIITLMLSDSPAVAWVDRSAVRMVFENLIDNACKYSHEGSEVVVSVADSKDLVIIEVSDSGVGINSQDVDRLFEKFSRVHNQLSEHVGGSGLGLYWVKKIVDLHGGIIDVRSEADKGTVFSVSLPKSL